MPIIPRAVAETNLSRVLPQEGFKLLYRGKVRDTYEIPGHPGFLLVVATDRVSIFDFVLPVLISGKGPILTALTVGWLTQRLQDFPHHLVAAGEGIDKFLPSTIRQAPELQSRGLIIDKLQMQPYEAVVRAYLTGSAWKEYQKTGGQVWGRSLPPGMREWQKLDNPIFTPTTKSAEGHDRPIHIGKFRQEHGSAPEQLALQLFDQGAVHASSRGLILVDTKFEFGASDGELVLGDEVFTADSSRFLDAYVYRLYTSQCKSPPTLDKQFVREWGESLATSFYDEEGRPLKFSQLEPQNPEHVDWVHSLTVPQEVIEGTQARYKELHNRLTG